MIFQLIKDGLPYTPETSDIYWKNGLLYNLVSCTNGNFSLTNDKVTQLYQDVDGVKILLGAVVPSMSLYEDMYVPTISEYLKNKYASIKELLTPLTIDPNVDTYLILSAGEYSIITDDGYYIELGSRKIENNGFYITQFSKNSYTINLGRPKGFGCLYEIYVYYSYYNHGSDISAISFEKYDTTGIISYKNCLKYTTSGPSITIKMPVVDITTLSNKVNTKVLIAIRIKNLKEYTDDQYTTRINMMIPTNNVSNNFNDDLIKKVKSLVIAKSNEFVLSTSIK